MVLKCRVLIVLFCNILCIKIYIIIMPRRVRYGFKWHMRKSVTKADTATPRIMDSVQGMYYTLFNEKADPRVKDWVLMKSPWPMVAILTIYMALVKIIVPKYMKDRKPYNLRNVIKWYNIMQIVVNTFVVWGIMTSGWTTTYHFGCMLPDYSENPEPLRMLRFMWWTVILKLLELVETIFFLLRKKEEQASFLHIYHHVSSATIIWVATKFVGGGGVSLPPMVNCGVHVLMYTYYLLSSEGSPKLKKVLQKYKKWLTILQMVQFTILLVHSGQTFAPSCKMAKGIVYLYIPNVVFVYFMFYQFFKKNYTKERKQHNHNGLKKDL